VKFETIIDLERCKECGLCTSVCPKKIIAFSEAINSSGYHPVKITEQDQCIGCAFCVAMCPDVAIEIKGAVNVE